jgi:hypothetical protein
MTRRAAHKVKEHDHREAAERSTARTLVPPGAVGATLLELQRTAGNQTVSAWLQSRSAVQTKSNNAGGEDAAERQADQAAEHAALGPVTKSLIVDDEVRQVQPGQMRKSEFLRQLRSSVSSAAEESLSGTMWSSLGCPYLDRWFNYFSDKPGAHVERALLKYAPGAAAAKSAHEYIPIVTQRVRSGIAEWSRTGEVSGLPDELAAGGMPGVSLSGLVGGALSAAGKAVSGLVSRLGSALSSVGRMLFKRRDGEAMEAEDPEAIRDQLGTGHALDSQSKGRLQSAFGADFSSVRVHTDATAQELSDGLNARAFTIGNDIAFAPGEYQPGTVVGDTLIAHELAHVMQQGGSSSFQPQRKESDSELDEDADLSALGAMVSLAGGAIVPQTKPRRRSALGLQRCSSGTGKQTKKTEQARKVEQTTATPADDWDFTVEDYAQLTSGGKKLRISSDSAWFPAPLQENLLNTLNFLLGPTQGPRGSQGANLNDFFHGHVAIKRQTPGEFIPRSADVARGKYVVKQESEYEKALGKGGIEVTKENLPAFTQAVQRTLPAATDALNEILKANEVVVVYHTFEKEKSRPIDMRLGDPRRNYVTPLATNKPVSITPPNPDNAGSIWAKDYILFMDFVFLIDRNGEVHIRPNDIRELSTVTGTPMKSY